MPDLVETGVEHGTNLVIVVVFVVGYTVVIVVVVVAVTGDDGLTLLLELLTTLELLRGVEERLV
jgi:hypothetical protein